MKIFLTLAAILVLAFSFWCGYEGKLAVMGFGAIPFLALMIFAHIDVIRWFEITKNGIKGKTRDSLPQVEQEKIKRQSREKLVTTDVKVKEQSKMLENLSASADNKDVESVNTIGESILNQYPKDRTLAKKVGAAYLLMDNKTKLDEAKKIFNSILQKDSENAEVWALMGSVHMKGRKWSKAAEAYVKAADFEKDPGQKVLDFGRAALAYWYDKQYEKAVEFGEKKLGEAEKSGDEDEIRRSKNSLAYYWAERGMKLEQAKEFCLELLGMEKAKYLAQILYKEFNKKDAQILDTLGRTLEASEVLDEAFLIARIVRQLEPDHPVARQNHERILEKLGKEMK
jgi:tetratricopeptide (TPR) repeat protein